MGAVTAGWGQPWPVGSSAGVSSGTPPFPGNCARTPEELCPILGVIWDISVLSLPSSQVSPAAGVGIKDQTKLFPYLSSCWKCL